MKKLVGLFAVLLVVAGMASAQVTTGTLVGIVKDATGAAIANTPVTAVNEETGVVYSGKTNSAGEYRIGFLPAGTYDIKATAQGFSTNNLKGLLVQANLNQTGDLVLGVASSSSVEVSTSASVSIDTTTSQLGSTFLAVETQDLPTSSVGLGVLNLSLLAPGVSSSGGIGAGTGPSVGGQRPRNNNFEVDGIDNNDKSVTGPDMYVPNDAVGEFSFLQNVFGAQYGHSDGGQFNSLIVSGTNSVHGRLYEYFDNRNLNAVDALQATANRANGVAPNFQPRYDFNRYGGQLGGPVFKDKLFLFSNFERQTTGQAGSGTTYCSPTAAGLATLKTVAFPSTNNIAQFIKYAPVAATQSTAADAGCPGSTISVTGTSGVATAIAVGDFSVPHPSYSNFYYSTSSGDYTISASDSFHVRYVYNRQDGQDTAATLPVFFTTGPSRQHLVALNETHIFTSNLTNDFRLGYRRLFNKTAAPPISFPGLDSFPNLVFVELNNFNLGPDPNAPQGNISNLYQAIEALTWVKGKHTINAGVEGRKAISPEVFVQRARGDYEYLTLNAYLNDLSPDSVGQRNALGPIGTPTFYGDQSAIYAYFNDDYRILPTLTLNVGLRYEFTSVPAGEKEQSFNSAASVPGLLTFNKPVPQKKNFLPRIGFAYSPDSNTSIRGGFGMGLDVLYDNIGTTEAPPQFQGTETVNTAVSTPNFLATGGLPPSFTFPTLAAQRAATTAYVPNQVLPYALNYTLGIEHVFLKNYTAEARYVGTSGRHLDVQDRLNVQNRVTQANQLPTAFGGSTSVVANGTNTLASISALPYLIPAYTTAGLTNTIVADQPYGSSSYNGLQTQLTRRYQHGLLLNVAYTWSKTMDTATADFNTSATNPRRPQDFQNIAGDYSLSALSRKHRFTVTAVYDLPFFKNSNWYMKNLVGNLEFAPVYTFQSPEYTTVQSNVDSNLNNDSASDRAFINGTGVKGTASAVTPIVNSTAACTTLSSKPNALINGTTTTTKSCSAAIIGYAEGTLNSTGTTFTGSNAYYVQGGAGTLPNGGRQTLPTGRTNDVDFSAFKRIAVYKDRMKVEIGLQAFNVLNHPQFLEGSPSLAGSYGSTGYRSFDTVNTPGQFNQKQLVFPSNARSMQLSGKFTF